MIDYSIQEFLEYSNRCSACAGNLDSYDFGVLAKYFRLALVRTNQGKIQKLKR